METTTPPSPRRIQPMEFVGCLEMELDDHSDIGYEDDDPASLYETNPLNQRSIQASPLVELAQGLVTYMKLWVQLYPRVSLGIGGVLFLWVAITFAWAPFAGSRRTVDMTRNHLERDYTQISLDYDLRKTSIHHWCLFGGNDNCYCEDPTEGASREEAMGWSESHTRNKHHISDNTVVQHDGTLDVVFYGAEIFQAWGEGRLLGRNFDEGEQIATYFNRTFRSNEATLQGLALGIYTDRSTNLLWRIQHGELPSNLRAKIFWILIGANDLALAMCSEDVVIMGILRVAEEIAFHNPNSKVVIQGLMPRSNHKDGSLHITDEAEGSSLRHNSHEAPFEHNNIWAYRTNDLDPTLIDPGDSTTSSALQQAAEQAKQPYFNYYIWPSILEINKELQGFCSQPGMRQFEYFDADDLFVEEVGNEKRIIRDLMPNSILLSYAGHKVLIDAVKEKVEQLLNSDWFD